MSVATTGKKKFCLTSYETTGYSVLSGVFTGQEVSLMQEAFCALESAATTVDSTTEKNGAVFIVEGRRIDRVCWCGAFAPYLLEIGRDQRLLNIVREILGSDSCDHLINQAHFKLPNDGVDFPWHQDSQYRRYGTELWNDRNGRGSFVQIYIAVDPATIENGCLYVFPESHTKGHLGLDTRTLTEIGYAAESAVPVLLEAGDIVIFGPYLIHGSSANTSSGPRRALINGYAYPGANRREYPGAAAGAGAEISLLQGRL